MPLSFCKLEIMFIYVFIQLFTEYKYKSKWYTGMIYNRKITWVVCLKEICHNWRLIHIIRACRSVILSFFKSDIFFRKSTNVVFLFIIELLLCIVQAICFQMIYNMAILISLFIYINKQAGETKRAEKRINCNVFFWSAMLTL